MSELTYKPAKSPFTTARPSLGVVSLLVLVAVLGMPVQAASLIGGPSVHLAQAPVAATTAPTLHHGLTVAPSLLNSPIGIRERALINAMVQSPAPGQTHLGALLSTVLPQTSAPANSHERAVAPAYSGGVNNYVQASDCQGWNQFGLFIPYMAGASIAQVGMSNQTLIAGGGSMYSIYNASGGSLCLTGTVGPAQVMDGYSNIFYSSNGGASWTNMTTPANMTHWHNSADVANGSTSTGNNIIAAAPNGVALELTGYAAACITFPVALTCGSSLGLEAPWGYGVTRSTDGGLTWSQTAQISSNIALQMITWPTICGISPGLYIQDLPEHPYVATNGTYAVATWDILHGIWDVANCTLAGLQATVQASYSTNAGLTWSAPVNVSGPVSQSPTVLYGPAPGNVVYDVFADVSSANASTSGQIQWQWSKSTDGGKTWSALLLIGLHNVNPTCFGCAATPDSIQTSQTPDFAVDNWTASPHSGSLYVAWQDNGTGSTTGEVQIEFEHSANGGTSWSAPTYLTPATASLHYLQPSVAVTPDGAVWVTYYGFGTSSGYYNVYGVVSTDGGTTWSPQFLVTSASSTPSSALKDIGFYQGSVGTSAGLVPIWSDCRSAGCSGANDVQLYTADLTMLNISTTAASPITAQVTVFGSTSAYPLPVQSGFDIGALVSVQVPQQVPIPGNLTYVDSFTGWSGISTSLNFKTTFTWGGAGALVADYTPVQAAFIAGTFSPNGPGASLTLDNAPVTLTTFNATAYQYTISVPSGQSYYLNASETNYGPDNRIVGVSAGVTTWENFSLQRLNGFLTGTITPVASYLWLNQSEPNAVNETAAIQTNGQFNIPVPFGWYWLNASKPGFTSQSCQGHEVHVLANAATTCTFNLVGGWIYGTVNPAKPNLVIRIDNAVVPNTFGVFNQSVSGGYHVLTATQPGYNLSVINAIQVTPGHATLVNVSLTNHGWIAGLIAPVAALKTVLLTVTNGTQGGPQVYNSLTGNFNVSVLGGYTWTVTVKATGYNTSTLKIPVTAGNLSSANFALNLSKTNPPPCTVNCTPNNGGNQSGSTIPLTLVLGIVVLIVIVAVVAMVLMMRRRGGGGSMDSNPPPPPEETYAGSNPSDLPKLQSDGSMGEANPPQ